MSSLSIVVILATVLTSALLLAEESSPEAAARRKATGAPVCVHMGTRSEGWAWPGGRFIHWAKCKGVVPTCVVKGKQGDGWYAHGALIAAAPCGGGAADKTDKASGAGKADGAGKTDQPTPTPADL